MMENSDFPSKWRGPGAHCVAMEMTQWTILLSWNFGMSVKTVVSALYRKICERYSIFCDYTPLYVHNVVAQVN